MFAAALRSSAFTAARTAARPQVARGGIGATGLGIAGRRWNQQESRGGKSKLIFRFGMRDIPVELYPMAFVVAAAACGAAFAVGRHFYMDGLRLTPGSGRESESKN